MKKQGFTLIELLAVIVVLAIVALIATPLTMSTINEAKKGAFGQTLDSVLKASQMYQAKAEMNEGLVECRYFSFGNDVEEVTIRDNKKYYPLKELQLKGNLPTQGEVKICGDVITIDASNGSYSGNYDGDRMNVGEGDLADNDFTTPVIDTFNTTSSLNRIVVSVIAHSPGVGGVIANYYYKINDGNYVKTTENGYIFNDLTPGTEYTITIKVENKSGVTKEESKTVKTKKFGELIIAEENASEWEKSKKVTISGTGEDGIIEYKIIKYNEETLEEEETEFKVYDEEFILLNTMATSEYPTTIVARYNLDGKYSEYKSYSITKIDTSAPTATAPAVNTSTTKPTSEASVVIRQSDNESGLDEGTIEYGYSTEKNGTYTWQTSSKLTKLVSKTTYYIKTRVKNNLGDQTESEVAEYTPGEINTCSVVPLTSGWATNKDVQITGSQTGTILQYQVGGTLDNNWITIENDGTVNIEENTTVYCRLWDGTTAGAYGSGTVNQIDRTEPSLSIDPIITTTSSITIPFTAEDSESEISSTTCVYGTSTSYGSNGTVSGSTCTISGLKAGTTYYYKLVTTNNSGLTKEVTGDTASGSTGITYSQTQTPSETTYAQSKAVTVTYTTSNVTSPVYYINTTVATTSNVAGSACGTSTDPGTCGTTSTTNFAANTWYKVTSNPTVTFTSNGTVLARINDGASYSSASSLDINKIDTSAPKLNLGTITKTTTTLTIPFTAEDSESEISSTTCVYGTSTSYGSNGTVSGSTCTISGLKVGTTYYYKLVTTNNSGLTKEITGDTSSGSTGITYSQTQTPSETTYAQSKAVTVTYTTSNVTSPVYYINTTVATTSNVAGYACGTSTDPGTCGTTSTTNFAANTWYKVTSNPTVTFTSNGTVLARINDGASYSSASSLDINKIDTSAPKLNLGTITKTTTTLTIPFTAEDSESEISSTTCVYGTSTSYGSNGTVSGSTCTISGLKAGTTYYYKLVTTNNSGLTKTESGSSAPNAIGTPTVVFTNTPTSSSDEYLTKQTATIAYSGATISSPYYYVKSTRATKSDVAGSACGTSTDPGTCGTTSTTNIEANTWYRFTSNPTLTYDDPSATTDTIYVAIGDGISISARANGTISKIYYLASNVSYTNSNASGVTNVEEALDYLYEKFQ